MWMFALSLTPYLALASCLTLIGTVIAIVYSQPACPRAAGFAA